MIGPAELCAPASEDIPVWAVEWSPSARYFRVGLFKYLVHHNQQALMASTLEDFALIAVFMSEADAWKFVRVVRLMLGPDAGRESVR